MQSFYISISIDGTAACTSQTEYAVAMITWLWPRYGWWTAAVPLRRTEL